MTDLSQLSADAIGWLLDIAWDEQDNYLHCAPDVDHGDEWPETARQRAKMCREIAEVVMLNGEKERWHRLADRFDHSADDYEKEDA